MADDSVEILNRLVRCSRAAAAAFSAAAEQASDEDVKQLLTERGVRWQRASSALQYVVRSRGGPVAEGAPAQGRWFSSGNAVADIHLLLLEGLATYEAQWQTEYENALAGKLPEPAHGIVGRQYDDLLEERRFLRRLSLRFGALD